MSGPWLDRGWQVFPAEPVVEAWVAAIRGPVLSRLDGPAGARRHGNTWTPGVDLIPNDAAGRAFGSGPLAGAALAMARSVTGDLPLHPGQLSVTYPGYPKRDPDESEANHRFRRLRDAAHLDGLLPLGPDRRRYLKEPHAYILGVALTEADAGAAPLVVYDGSHQVLRAAMAEAFAEAPADQWSGMDVTDIYQAARRRCFEACPRREIPLRPGDCVLVHRLCLHGVAPWAEGAHAAPEGRAIAYFRPCFPDVADWLALP